MTVISVGGPAGREAGATAPAGLRPIWRVSPALVRVAWRSVRVWSVQPSLYSVPTLMDLDPSDVLTIKLSWSPEPTTPMTSAGRVSGPSGVAAVAADPAPHARIANAIAAAGLVRGVKWVGPLSI